MGGRIPPGRLSPCLWERFLHIVVWISKAKARLSTFLLLTDVPASSGIIVPYVSIGHGLFDRPPSAATHLY